jgi:signal transduction histidine kinase
VAIRLEARPQGAHALIAIQDGGPGVPLAERERIFERFIRLDEEGSSRRGGGVGLGLYVARRLARAQGGDLRVAEPVGVEGGARFELLLPLAGEPEPAADLGPVGLLPAREVAREVVGQGQQAGQASVGEALPPAAQA